MTLISRYGFLCTIRTYENVLFSSRVHFSYLYSRWTIPSLQFAKPTLCSQQRFATTSEKSKQNKDFRIVEGATEIKLSTKARLKQAVRDYGATVIVFHVAISLTSLGISYLAVSNGLDVMNLLARFGFPDYVIKSEMAVGGSTFVMAYAVHKIFAPARICLTLASVPFIVRYLRKIKLLKPPK